jgi:hypothetical protein
VSVLVPGLTNLHLRVQFSGMSVLLDTFAALQVTSGAPLLPGVHGENRWGSGPPIDDTGL